MDAVREVVANLICARCGEPWDCTGGLHFTHTDMVEQDFKALLAGSGCLCCRENLGDENNPEQWSDTKIVAWQESVEALSEGQPEYMYATFDVRPNRGMTFADLYDPGRA